MILRQMFKFTFEDGSEALGHYGTKGMKWGVWNDDAKRRYGFLDAVYNAVKAAGGLIDEGWPNEVEEQQYPEYWSRKEESDPDSDMAAVNPYFTAGMVEYKLLSMMKGLENLSVDDFQMLESFTNCADCTLVYDLRRRGYNVDANLTQNLAYIYDKGIGDYYEGAKNVECYDIKDAFKALDSMPDGARGGFAGTTVNGGGHAIAWEKEHGQVVFRDAQTNTKYTKHNIDKLFQTSNVEYVRLDDKKPNLSRIRAEGLVSPGGTSGRADRVQDRIRSAYGEANQKRRRYEWYTTSEESKQNLNRELQEKLDKARRSV